MPLRPKGADAGIMLSDFLTPLSSLYAPDSISNEFLAQHKLRRYAWETLEFGGEKWWRNED